MDQVIALPVAGEAFLLHRGGHRVLVDGGWNSVDLALALAAESPGDDLDIVVCTHADRDHAGGLADLLRHWRVHSSAGFRPGRIGEFWLPGRWVDALPELLERPDRVVCGLLVELGAFIAKGPDWLKTDNEEALGRELADMVTAERRQVSKDERRFYPDDVSSIEKFGSDFWGEQGYVFDPPEEPEWLMRVRKNEVVLHHDRRASLFFSFGTRVVCRYCEAGTIGKAVANYWLNLINAAKNIRAIALAAIKHKIPIRWFDYDEFSRTRLPMGGIRGFLMPLNAVEQSRAPLSFLSYLTKLSPDNEACLAFIAPPHDSSLGVVFCGDSPLGDGRGYKKSFLNHLPKPSGSVVATAPHHGSENNSVAYRHLTAWVSVLGWLRTGGDKRHPGPTFKGLSHSHKICSHCPQRGLKRQIARFGLSPLRAISGYRCCC